MIFPFLVSNPTIQLQLRQLYVNGPLEMTLCYMIWGAVTDVFQSLYQNIPQTSETCRILFQNLIYVLTEVLESFAVCYLNLSIAVGNKHYDRSILRGMYV